jgi:hypothetical protein
MIKRQTERDFPHGLMWNGLIDGTKCQSSEKKRELILIIVHSAPNKSQTSLKNRIGFI